MFWQLTSADDSRIAIYDDFLKRSVTYGELKIESDSLLYAIDENSKKLIFVFCDNSYLSVLVYLSMLRGGHAVFLGNGKMDASFKENLVTIYRPDLIWSIEDSDQFDGYEKFSIVNKLTFFRRRHQVGNTIHPDLTLLLSTSGTTGSPKLVRLSWKNIQSNAESIVKYLEITSDEKAITTLPLHYSYGLSLLHSHLQAGATLVCTNHSIITKPFWVTFKEQSCTSIAGVPFTYQILDQLRFERMNLPSLRTLTQAGGRLDNGRIRKYLELAQKRGIRFYVMYGQTEASPRISYVPYDHLHAKIGSIGVPIPGGAMCICNGGKEIAAPGIEGELVYKGDNVMMGYAENRDELSADDKMNGELRTGDIAYRDKDGYFYIKGREKRFLKIYGLRFNLDDVEHELEAYLSTAVACYGNDDELRIVVEMKKPLNLRGVISHIADLYRLHHSVIHAESIERLPRTISGKKDYQEIERIRSNE